MVRAGKRQQRKFLEKEGAEAADRWLRSIINFLKGVSRLTKSVTARGNSTTLTRMFNPALSAVRFDTKFSRGLSALQKLKNYDLVYNSDLKSILKERKLITTKSRKYVHLSREVKDLLKCHPDELEAVLGAIQRLEEGGLDAYRQCLSSCRNAIERLVISLSGRNRWNDGLNELIPSSTKRKNIKSTFNFLSGYGAHGKENPSQEDARAGVDQTLSAIRLIISSTGNDD